MSNRLFQSVIGQYRGTVDRVFGITDDEGRVVACSEPTPPSDLRLPIASDRIVSGMSEMYLSGGFTFRPVGAGIRESYSVFVEGTDGTAETVSAILAVSFANLKRLYDEKTDRSAFVRNVILDNILPEETAFRARDMRMTVEEPRVLYIVRNPSGTGTETVDLLQNMFPDRQRDFVIPVSETDTVLVKTLKPGTAADDNRELAVRIADTFSTELFARVTVGMSAVSERLTSLPEAYREAVTALAVNEVFGGERTVAEFDRLGIGRLLYMLPTQVCRKYLEEVFRMGSIRSLEPEILTTIRAFFENSLNVSETSRKLFIHRNTLVYRLEKIQKLTGLDLRKFDDAITFRVALMVDRYLEAGNPGDETENK